MKPFQTFTTSPPMNTQRTLLFTALCSFALLIGACSDGADGDENPDAIDTVDTDGSNDLDDDTQSDLSDSDDASSVVEELGKTCRENSDCLSDFCVKFIGQEEGFCSIRCLANSDDCPSASESNQGIEFTCESLPITGDDLEFACIGEDFCYDPDEDQYGFGPGCPRIGFDCNQSDASINPGAPERCDAIDHNCNGFIADAVQFPAGSQTCIVDANVSICRSGRRVCNAITDEAGVEFDVEEACIANIEPGSQVERCNGIDDDCDGVADDVDPDIQGVGQACSSGINDCVDGTIICDPVLNSLKCESGGDSTSDGEPDVCDGIDNDCDDETDENFKDENGVYDRLEHCGACNVDCVQQLPGDPSVLHVTASCDVTLTGATCGFTCDEGFVNADGFDENGCEFAPDEDAVYVARPDDSGSDGGGCGAFDSPCATIAMGISRAQSQARTRVLVGSGAFPEPVELADGISVLGGHDPRTWTRNTSIFVSSISGGIQVNNDVTAVFAENITNPTELSGFTIVPAPTSAGQNSVGLLIRNSNQNLQIRNNSIFAGLGGDGQRGPAGGSGSAGSNGAAGLPSLWVGDTSGNCAPNGRAGGSAGSNTCNGQNVSGGLGGGAANCVSADTSRGNAPAGNGAAGGAGGANATDVDANLSGLLCNSPANLRNSSDGLDGGDGSDGSGGSGAGNALGTVNDSWSGVAGSPGDSGTNGSGGGGGGAAINIENEDNNKDLYLAATGGGGGAGGCSGSAGGGGTAGGGSFAIFVSGGTAPVIENNLLARGAGGGGGAGGNGGAGGSPGTGGNGGPRDVSGAGPSLICVEPGRPGGDGGRGGHGGGGGGGAGGISFDIALHGVSGAPDYTTSNSFNVDGGTNTGGSGGNGGSSPNNAGSAGIDGAAGLMTSF